MANTVSKKKRGKIMSKIKSKDSKIEIKFRKAIWRAGFRYRKNSVKYFGKPDLVLKKYKAVLLLILVFGMVAKNIVVCPQHIENTG